MHPLMSQIISAPDTMQPAVMDFSSLMEKAMAHPAGNDVAAAPVAAPETPTPAEAVTAPTTPEPAPAAPSAPVVSPAEQKILDLPDDAVVRTKIDGKEELVSVKDFRDGISREAVFTRRMQTLAEQRRQAEAELAAQYAAQQAERQALENLRRELTGQLQQVQTPAQAPAPGVKPPDPQDLATMGDVQAIIAAQVEQIKQAEAERERRFVEALGQAGQKVQSDAVHERNTALFTEGLQTVMTKPEYAVLKKLPYPAESLRYAVAAMNPQSIQEAVQFADTVAKGWSDEIRAEVMETMKRQEAAKAQAKLEPPAQSAAPPAPQYKPGSAFKKNGGFDWDALRARAEGML